MGAIICLIVPWICIKIKKRQKGGNEMKILSVLVVLLLLTNVIFAAKVLTLGDLNRPFYLKADDSRLYISDGPTVSIYSLKDFLLIKKIGRVGEGPQEFKVSFRNSRGVMISLTDEGDFLVNSINKVSFFTSDGEFLSETRTNGTGTRFRAVGHNKYVGEAFLTEKNITYNIRNLYDADFVRGKELYRRQSSYQAKGSLNPFYFISPGVEIYKNKIYINGIDNQIYVFDDNGKTLNTLTFQYERLKVTGKDKKRIDHWYRTFMQMKKHYPKIKGRIEFPEYFPAIRMFNVADEKIYILTYKKKDNMSECVILDVKGNFLEKKMVPFAEKDERVWCPYTIKNGTLYQLIEDEKKQEWELHVTELE